MYILTKIVVLFSLLPTFGLAVPAASSKASSTVKGTASKAVSSSSKTAGSAKATGQASSPAMNTNMGPSDVQVMNAVMSWMNDTGKVSKFLNTATSFSGDEFTRQATIALNSEKDELNHKMILDAAVGQMDMVQAANDTLATQGTFQAVVDALQSMVDNGPDTAQMQVDAINQNRCVNVLPNIDAYFAAAGQPDMQSVRPSGCLEVQNAAASSSSGASATTGKPTSTQKPAATGKSIAASTQKAATTLSAPKATASAKSASGSAPKAAATGKSSSKPAASATGKATSAASATKAKAT